LRHHGHCVAPGFVRTGRVAPILDSMGPDLLETVALRRWGTPEECAGVIEFLATDLGAYVTGANHRGRRWHRLTEAIRANAAPWWLHNILGLEINSDSFAIQEETCLVEGVSHSVSLSSH